jgi:uncharacterized protein YdiU (UPF0061 family)
MSAAQYRPSQAHAALGDGFFDLVAPAVFPACVLRYRNQPSATRVGLAGLSDAAWLDHFAGFTPLPGSFERPLALRYHGHQFRSYNPELGDGRGFLFAQLHDLDDGRLLDLATKGSGRTPWSRGGDGRLTLKGGVREILATTMLEALGVNTSKSFSLIETGEELYRSDEPSPTRAAVLVRLSHSHIRIGTFQRLSYLGETDALLRLVDHAIAHYLPDAWREDVPARVLAFFETVVAHVARTGAAWMAAGFVHGVLNTDNINITGESFDYGPWRFLPTYDPEFTAAYFDHSGLYAYGRQPEALMWNLARLAGCLLPFVEKPALEAALAGFETVLQAAFAAGLARRLGLRPASVEADSALGRAWYGFLLESQVGFEQAHFDWAGGLASADRAEAGPAAEVYKQPWFDDVRAALAGRAAAVDLSHPYFARQHPTTLLVEDVENLWAPIADHDDWALFTKKLTDISEMSSAMQMRQS